MDETYYVKIQGKANIPSRLTIGHNFKLTSDCSVTSETRSDNDDGSYDVTFKVEPVTIEITGDNGEVVKARDPRKNSQKFRNYLYKLYYEEGYTEPFDSVYDAAILEALAFMPELLRGAIKRLNQ